MTLSLIVPGEPFAQPRPRAARRGKFVSVYDPPEAKAWKGVAQVHMQEALRLAGLPRPAFSGPVALYVLAVFSCPKSDYRKREPQPRRPYTGRRDWDNIGKAVSDAGNGVLWLDDAQIVLGTVERIIGAQGEAPHVEIEVREARPDVQLAATVGR